MTSSKETEVAWGESFEVEILKRWAKCSPYARGVKRWLKGHKFADFDFFGLSEDGLPLVYVEVKKRRTPWGTFGDVMFPTRKHRFANRAANFNVPVIGVTEYGCGALIEVNLGDVPDEQRLVTRRDRHQPVSHVFYTGKNVKVLEAPV